MIIQTGIEEMALNPFLHPKNSSPAFCGGGILLMFIKVIV